MRYRGGKLFEFYMSTFAPYAVHRKWTTLLDELRDHPVPFPLIVQLDEIYEKERVRYGVFLLNRLSCMGNSANNQIFYLTLYLYFKGLSNSGREMTSQFGWTLSVKTFKTRRNAAAESTIDDLRLIFPNSCYHQNCVTTIIIHHRLVKRRAYVHG